MANCGTSPGHINMSKVFTQTSHKSLQRKPTMISPREPKMSFTLQSTLAVAFFISGAWPRRLGCWCKTPATHRSSHNSHLPLPPAHHSAGIAGVIYLSILVVRYTVTTVSIKTVWIGVSSSCTDTVIWITDVLSTWLSQM